MKKELIMKDFLKKYNVTFNNYQKRIIYVTLILMLFLLLSIHGASCIVERLVLFSLLFLLFLVISENLLITIGLTLFIFLIINLLMMYKKKMNNKLQMRNSMQIMERFDNNEKDEKDEKDKKEEKNEKDKKDEKDDKDEIAIKDEIENGGSKMTKILMGGADINLDLLKGADVLSSSANIAALSKKMNGGIELKKSDLEETKPLGVDAKDYSNDKKPSPLRDAQKETYELINTVNTLKDTLTTLSPILQEGKKLMEVFESFRI